MHYSCVRFSICMRLLFAGEDRMGYGDGVLHPGLSYQPIEIDLYVVCTFFFVYFYFCFKCPLKILHTYFWLFRKSCSCFVSMEFVILFSGRATSRSVNNEFDCIFLLFKYVLTLKCCVRIVCVFVRVAVMEGVRGHYLGLSEWFQLIEHGSNHTIFPDDIAISIYIYSLIIPNAILCIVD